MTQPLALDESAEARGFADVALPRLFWVFFYIGATSFGGGVVAYLREHLVERQRWLDADHFLAALEIAETVPGLIATNVSVIVGSRLRGVAGAIAAVLGMTVPGAVSVFMLGVLYAHFRKNPEVGAVLAGVGAAAVGLIFAVSLQIGYRELKLARDFAILIPVFILVGVFHISLIPVLVVLAPIAIQLNRPDAKQLAVYHAEQSAYHAQLAEHHGEVSARHAAESEAQ
jgi:chromate transporter